MCKCVCVCVLLCVCVLMCVLGTHASAYTNIHEHVTVCLGGLLCLCVHVSCVGMCVCVKVHLPSEFWHASELIIQTAYCEHTHSLCVWSL